MQKEKTIKLNRHLEPRSLNLEASAGFTLIEMIVSIALFSFVMLAATSVLLKVVDANNKAQGLKTTMNNLSLVLESMARNLRTGSGYTQLNNNDACSSGGEDNIGYIDQRGSNTFYLWNAGGIEISRGGSGNYARMTAPEVTIDRMCFYVSGQVSADFFQPKILMTVGGVVSLSSAVGAKTKTTSRFDIQTTISQRFPDVAR